MKRPIKFRGHAIYNSLGRPVDKIVYGDLTQSEYAIEIWDNGWGCDADSYVVDPESVAQLVGFDRDGNEVYEGDTIEFNGCTYTARLEEYWDGDIPAGEICSAMQEVIYTSRPVRMWQEYIARIVRIEGEDSPSLPVFRKKLAEACPPFKMACERFIAAYQNFTKELEATK